MPRGAEPGALLPDGHGPGAQQNCGGVPQDRPGPPGGHPRPLPLPGIIVHIRTTNKMLLNISVRFFILYFVKKNSYLV